VERVGTDYAAGWLFGDGWHADLEAAMKAVLVLVGLVAFVAYGVAVAYASERHAVIVDAPEVITMTYASPDTWHTLPPPVQLNEQVPATTPELDQINVPNSIWPPTYLAANQPQ
jgi:hypothetical protein